MTAVNAGDASRLTARPNQASGQATSAITTNALHDADTIARAVAGRTGRPRNVTSAASAGPSGRCRPSGGV